ncbi:helix-turn-helix domain-containing protein [Thermophilibacter provencensis]|uniref:Helix-turn-helix domain-containing protein n=1 Tax=Thermophilibacter provencensis TaxID=1852386 RepID=A0ABT7V299_9ACTN|nr:helix-turn-helix domain-containing protein [Thermophilibacter provencensis]MDM8270099.1 helix-turn-helix domain-containing protein [Thermophilibacter provencensis]
MSESINIGRTIARERRRAGVTQEALAAHLGVSKAAVSKWELGQSLPDVSLLPRIAAYFSLTLDELFDWRDEFTSEESAALYAEVCALGEKDLGAAHERLRALASEHYSDVNLLLMLASLLTVWAGDMATPFTPAGEKDGSPDAPLDADDLADEALTLLGRVLEVATDPSTLYLAQQQKATTLFQAGRYAEAASLLEPLVRRQDSSASTMLLASAYRKLARDDEALGLLQAERLRAASFVLSSLMQEVGMRDDAAFALAAGNAAEAVFQALDMGTVNPFFSATMSLEVAEVLRKAGEKDAALDALARASEDLAAVSACSDPSGSPLWDRMADRLDPAQAGEAWAAHKSRQSDEVASLMRQAFAERVASSGWRELAGDEPRYRDVLANALRLRGL